MPFRFAWLCELLEDLENWKESTPKFPARDKNERQKEVIRNWFRNHRRTVLSRDTDLVAILSSLFPERRTDRVYNIQALRLLNILSRALGLGNDRLTRLRSWKTRGQDDLASWTAGIVKETDAGRPSSVTVEQIDKQLEQMAARRRHSSPLVKARQEGPDDIADHIILGPIIQHLSSIELKWLIRLILKDFGQAILDERYILSQIHPLLPRFLQFQSTFEAAVHLLRHPQLINAAGHTDEHGITQLTTPIKHSCLRPCVRVKIGRPNFIKARSLKQCLNITKNSRWSIEPKYDGEYCQIHIGLCDEANPIRIFAKSGKDATKDRRKTHSWIRKCLKIGTEKCKFRQTCILEGEMVVIDDRTREILPFHKIRKHVDRSGAKLGTELDSQPHPHERLVVIFYDCLLVDEEVTMALPYTKRRARLSSLLESDKVERVPLSECAPKPLPNRSNWSRVDFSKHSSKKASRMLENKLADAIAQRCEGLILKPCDSPYFSIDNSKDNAGKIIKLKKDYIQGLGDTADFAVIGGRRDLKAVGTVTCKWTHFVIATLENKEAVLRFGAQPAFRVVESLTRPCIPVKDMDYMAAHGAYTEEQYVEGQTPSCFTVHRSEFDPKLDVVFKKPFVVELLGSGFDKPSSHNTWMLRHPRIIKLHSDRGLQHGQRGLEDVVSFDDLQKMAVEAVNIPSDVAEEEAQWHRRIERLSRAKSAAHLRSPTTDATSSGPMTESFGTRMTTPCRPQRPMAPVFIRVDSVDMLPNTRADTQPAAETAKEPVIASNNSSQTFREPLASRSVDHIPVPTAKEVFRDLLSRMQKGNPALKKQIASQPVATPAPQALAAHIQSDAVFKAVADVIVPIVISPSRKRTRCSMEHGPTGIQPSLKRSKTAPEKDIENMGTVPAEPSHHETRRPLTLARSSPDLGANHVVPPRPKPPRSTGHAGESQAAFYDVPVIQPLADDPSIETICPTAPTEILGEALPPVGLGMHAAASQRSSTPYTQLRNELMRTPKPSSPVHGQLHLPSKSHRIQHERSTVPAASAANQVAASPSKAADSYKTPPPSSPPQPRKDTHAPSPVKEQTGSSRTAGHEPRWTSISRLKDHFQNATIYLPPHISSHQYLTQHLLPSSAPANTTHNLAHWTRELYPQPRPQAHFTTHADPIKAPPIDNTGRLALPKVDDGPVTQPRTCPTWKEKGIVPETQASPKLQKIMLVESRMPSQAEAAVDKVVKEVQLRRNELEGVIGEVVEVWDWRIVESLAAGGEGGTDAKELGGWYQGCVRWDAEQGGNVFVDRLE